MQIFLTTKSTTPASIRGTQRDRRLPVEHGSTHPDFSGVEFATSADGLSVDRPTSFVGWRSSVDGP